MISRVYISHSRDDEEMALQLSRALWRVGLESYAALYNLSPGISLAERVSFGIRNSECLVALLTREGAQSPTTNQEIGLARGIDLLIIPLLEEGAEMTQYLTPQEEVDSALEKGSCLETICSYCQNRISLDPRTFAPVL